MHSSRMRTARALTIGVGEGGTCPEVYLPRAVYLPGVYLLGGCTYRGTSARGVYVPKYSRL